MESGKSPKNVVFIYTDQMHKFALHAMGTDDIITPNLDQLAKEGTLFENAYSNCPICTPFRINLCTGLYASQTKAFRNNYPIPKRCTTLADVFNNAGYHTSFVGKWHVGKSGNRPIPKSLRGGFRDFIGYQCYNGFYKDVHFYDEDNEVHVFNRHRTDVTTDIALERLEGYNQRGIGETTPLLMVIGYQAPHYPVQPSPKYEQIYKGKTIKRRKNTQEIDPYTKTGSPRSPRPKELCADFQRYGNDLNEYLRLYYALCTQIDANVGRIIAKLKALGMYENTLIVFTSDHGDMQGSHGLRNKTLPYEESSGIPLIIRTPDGKPGTRITTPVTTIDYFPTLLDYARIDPPADLKLPGKSILPACTEGKLENHIPAFSEMTKWRLIRDGPYKLVVEGETQTPTKFFHLENDPYELTNMVNEEAQQPKIKELRAKIVEWQRDCQEHEQSYNLLERLKLLFR